VAAAVVVLVVIRVVLLVVATGVEEEVPELKADGLRSPEAGTRTAVLLRPTWGRGGVREALAAEPTNGGRRDPVARSRSTPQWARSSSMHR
jgi:hypothetical protein